MRIPTEEEKEKLVDDIAEIYQHAGKNLTPHERIAMAIECTIAFMTRPSLEGLEKYADDSMRFLNSCVLDASTHNAIDGINNHRVALMARVKELEK